MCVAALYAKQVIRRQSKIIYLYIANLCIILYDIIYYQHFWLYLISPIHHGETELYVVGISLILSLHRVLLVKTDGCVSSKSNKDGT